MLHGLWQALRTNRLNEERNEQIKTSVPENMNKRHSGKWQLLKPEPRYLLAGTRLGLRWNAIARMLSDPCFLQR